MYFVHAWMYLTLLNESGHMRFLPVCDLCPGKGLDLVIFWRSIAATNQAKLKKLYFSFTRYVSNELYEENARASNGI